MVKQISVSHCVFCIKGQYNFNTSTTHNKIKLYGTEILLHLNDCRIKCRNFNYPTVVYSKKMLLMHPFEYILFNEI